MRSASGTTPTPGSKGARRSTTIGRDWKRLNFEQKAAAAGSVLLIVSTFGPFSFVDARVSLSQSVFNWADIKSTQSAKALRRASEHNYKASRELVVQAAANAYLLVTADAALVDAWRRPSERSPPADGWRSAARRAGGTRWPARRGGA